MSCVRNKGWDGRIILLENVLFSVVESLQITMCHYKEAF